MAGKDARQVTVFIDGACTRNGQTGSRAGYGIYF